MKGHKDSSGTFHPHSSSHKLKSSQILGDDPSTRKAKDIQQLLKKTSGKMGTKKGIDFGKPKRKEEKKLYAVVGHAENQAGILAEYGEMTHEQALKKARSKFPNTKDFEIVNVHDDEDRSDLS